MSLILRNHRILLKCHLQTKRRICGKRNVTSYWWWSSSFYYEDEFRAFSITMDQKKALLRGIADVTGYIRKVTLHLDKMELIECI